MTDESEDWTPDKERKDDPAKIQKEAVKIQKEALAFYKKILEKQQAEEAKRAAVAVGPGEYLAVAEYPGHPHARGPRPISLQIRPIDNGFILALAHESYPGHSGPAKEHYYLTIPELLDGLGTIVKGTFVEIPDGT